MEYLKEGEETPSTRLVEPYALERRLPHWYVHTWDRTADGERSFRLDRMRSARLTRDKFEAREGFEPRGLRDVRHARIWYSKSIARWRVERGDARERCDPALCLRRQHSCGAPRVLHPTFQVRAPQSRRRGRRH